MTRTEKAYCVLERDEGTGGIVFANRIGQARRRAARRFFEGERYDTICRREPWADVHVDGRVPVGSMVENGWRFECSNCGRTIDSDMSEMDMDEGGERYRDWVPADVVGSQRGIVYCDVRCETQARVAAETSRRMSRRAVSRFTRILLARLPDAQVVDMPEAYGGQPGAEFHQKDGVWLLHAVRVPFTYPGAQFGYAALEYHPRGYKKDRRISFLRPTGDVDVFDAYLAAHDKGTAHE